MRLSLVLIASVLIAALAPPLQDQTPAAARLADVQSWFYYLEVVPDPAVIVRLIASDYDMVVIDLVVSDQDSQDYDIAATVAALQESGKLVIAYVDIGQAESFRSYWAAGWTPGDPAWIVGTDPDGWAENYPVAYWWDEWQALWFDAPHALLDLVLDSGFDGLYMDWVEAYSDENVVVRAAREGVDPVAEMIWFVADISDYTKAAREDFIIIAQNAAELAEYTDYLDRIDAVAQEQIWFDGAADGGVPEGDCPLPATDADIDGPAYIAALTAACRAQFEAYPESTLHVSSEGYLYYLKMAQNAGKVIFTVDYALEAENVAQVYATARALGFIPFASNRMLDRYVAPVPWGE